MTVLARDDQDRPGRALAPYHVRRPRLVAELECSSVGLVVAGGGWGKTTVSVELGRQLGLASVSVLLGPHDRGAGALLVRVVAALRRARLAELAAAVEAEAGDPVAAVDALAAALEREPEPVLVAVDDAHHAGPESTLVLGRFAAALPEGHRLLVLARRPPAALSSPGVIELGSEQLAFRPEEAVELFAAGFGLELDQADARALVRATAGWPAALVLAANALAISEQPAAELQQIIARHRPLQRLIDQQLGALGTDERSAMVQLAHLPLLSPAVVEAATGDTGVLERAGAAGIPVSVRPDGWWELPGPVQERIACAGPLRASTALAVAPVYAGQGELRSAVHVLLSAGEADAAASLLAAIAPQEADELGYLELQALLDSLPAGAIERHPAVLVHLARACEPAAQVRLRAQTLACARPLAELADDHALLRTLDVELARDLVRDGEPDEAESLASEALVLCGAAELDTRARALDVLGRVAAWRRDEQSLAQAERLLLEAHALCLRLGQRSWASQVVMPLAHGVCYARGDHELAIGLIDRTLDELPSRSAHRGVVLSFYADILIDCGRFEEADAAVREGWRLGEFLSDHRICAYAAWSAAKLASQAGDRERTVRELRAAERHRHDWFDHPTGAEFLADAADLLDRVGETELALRYLERARKRNGAALALQIAEAAVLARSGDPDEAEQAFERLERLPRLEPRERWRMTLLRAYAALRRGDADAGPLAAEAFELAAQLGKPHLPLVRDRTIAERLVALAAAAGSRAAASCEGAARPLAISVLGRFELRRGGEPVRLPTGKPEQLVKLLAISGGRLPAEQAIEDLWPEVDPRSGRKRLRNVLNRLHAAAPDVALRERDLLTLGDVEVDAQQFEQHAARALDGVGGPTARVALARYRGTLLPDDPYEPWAVAPRERLERLFVALLDKAAGSARAAGEFDEAVRLLERALELDPYDEQRYLQAATLLLEQGRRAAAVKLLDRAARALAELGVPTPAAHQQLAAAARR